MIYGGSIWHLVLGITSAVTGAILMVLALLTYRYWPLSHVRYVALAATLSLLLDLRMIAWEQPPDVLGLVLLWIIFVLLLYGLSRLPPPKEQS